MWFQVQYPPLKGVLPIFRSRFLWIQRRVIQGSRDQSSFDSFPGLIAVFHALRRLPAPRHPPHALSSLAAPAPAPPARDKRPARRATPAPDPEGVCGRKVTTPCSLGL